MATVKGDVHDIGKNIVGVVLGCNGYNVIDLGVMVPADKILDKAVEENVDIIGLSGLITPSLEEMVHVDKEMKRRNMTLPLMIGGATTSRTHTAVKIEGEYDHGVCHVLDASRSVSVVGQLLNANQKPIFLQSIKEEYAKLREEFAGKQAHKEYLPYNKVSENGEQIEWKNYKPTTPKFIGTKTLNNIPIEKIRPIIDWNPFFIAWEMKGKFPNILNDSHTGPEATKLFDDANA